MNIKKVFHPSCAIFVYKPELADRIFDFIKLSEPNVSKFTRCCKYPPNEEMTIISSCPGCYRAFSEKYEGVNTLIIWEYLADSHFPFPDYKGKAMSIHDPCNVRGKDNVYDAVRNLLQRMNITVEEPPRTREKSACCGTSVHSKLSAEELMEFSSKRAADFICDDVVVYCASCMYFLKNAGKKTRHLLDLIFQEESAAEPIAPKEWKDKVAKHMKKSR
jgi:Fe-S oxidoreductase